MMGQIFINFECDQSWKGQYIHWCEKKKNPILMKKWLDEAN
jgi:hypothetical protein